MKQRLITAGIGLLLFFIIMAGFNTVIFDIAICLVSLIAVHELLMATGITKNIPLTVLSLAASVFPFLMIRGVFSDIHIMILAVIVVASIMFLMLLAYHETLRFEKMATAFLIFTVFPTVFSTLLMIRNQFDKMNGIYYVIFIFACAWGSDSGAYFGGRFFGKHKLAPKISPKKTIEGVYGGIIGCLIVVSIVTAAMYYISIWYGQPLQFSFLGILVMSIVGSLVSVLGDLTASVIKRQNNVKDFGTIMPGHGGVMDRFDSVLFVAPFVYVLLQFFLK